MMLIVALGAIRAILSTSPGLSSRFSTLTISFLLAAFDDTFIATLTTCPSPPPIPRILRTSRAWPAEIWSMRSEEHTSELQSQSNLVCRLLLEKKKKTHRNQTH